MNNDKIREAFNEWALNTGEDKEAWDFRDLVFDIHGLGFYAGYKASQTENREKLDIALEYINKMYESRFEPDKLESLKRIAITKLEGQK